MSTFSFPERPAAEIIAVLAQTGIAALKPEDLTNPSADVVCALYSNFLSYVDPVGYDPDNQIAFSSLEFLDNPEHHDDAIKIFDLYRKVREVLASIRFGSFNLRDLLKPDPRRTSQILSTVVNFLYYREDKLNMLRPIADQFPSYDEKRTELETRIAELNKEILDHEAACQMEEPMVHKLEAEVKELRQTIQNYNKQQMSLKTLAKGLKEKTDAINDKISQADFELVKNVQENSKLLSKIVQSPDKLQRALEEKKANRSEVKNSERLAMQSVQEKNVTLEVYSKAYEKMSKHFSQVQAIQEQVNSAKTIEKEVKALKAKLSDEGVSNMSLEAKIVERQGKAKQAEELVKLTERERDMRHAEEIHRLNTLRAEMEWKLQCLEPRERKVEALVAKGDNLCSDASSVREAGKAKQQELHAKLEEIVRAFHSYSSTISSLLQRIEVGVEKEALGTEITG
uniref:Kinetochore protein NUF2 homolog n=1 Tax=Elaeis guineensis var. tenera TaxID=51953 RepID=A0A6I9RSI4_ELAGV|nr:kinetochore protein NUF2 homolog [Elaeis guineensis]